MLLVFLVVGTSFPSHAWGQSRPPQRRSAPRTLPAEAVISEEAWELAPPVAPYRTASAGSATRRPLASEPSLAVRKSTSRVSNLGMSNEYVSTHPPGESVLAESVHPQPQIGESYFEEEGMLAGDSCGPEGCGSGSCGRGACGGSCGGCGQCWHCLHLPLCLPQIRLQNLEIFAGVHGFTGPANRGGTGSFGFHEGFNWGGCLPFLANAVSLQIGGMATQSNFNGSDFTLDDRNQGFITGGLFRRADCGLQGGIVFDYMHDEWYYQVDLTQLRGELSWVFAGQQELGAWVTTGFDSVTVDRQFRTAQQPNGARVRETFEVNNLFAFFYRRQFCDGGEGRVWGGFTGEGDGLVGAEFRLPLAACVDLQSEFTYLIPRESIDNNGLNEESWNIGMNLVWYPGCLRRCGSKYDRPLFNVANNGNFLVDRR